MPTSLQDFGMRLEWSRCMSEIEPLPEGVETEADGLRAGALRIAKYQHQAQQMRQRNAAKPLTPEQIAQQEQRRKEFEHKRSEAIANEERDAPIRVRFHAWLEKSGYRTMPIPEPGRSYSGSHVQTLWEAYLDATLQERNKT